MENTTSVLGQAYQIFLTVVLIFLALMVVLCLIRAIIGPRIADRIVATNMMMQTIRKPIRANLVAAARSGLFFIPLIFLLPHFFGLSGVEMCQAWADVCAFLLSLPVALSGFRDMRMQRVDNQLLK